MDNTKNKSEDIDFLELIQDYTKYWYLFLFSTMFLIFVGYLYSRYTPKNYSASTTILIKDENNTSIGSDNIIDGIDLFGKNKNIKNEIGILKSFSLTKKTLQQIDFNISYLNEGKLSNFDVYTKSPFTVILDSNHVQCVGIKFDLNIISKEKFSIKTKIKTKKIYDVISETYIKISEPNYRYKKTHLFNEWITTDHFRFKIIKNDFSLFEYENWNNFSFTLNDMNLLTDKFLKRISIREIEKDASILRVSLEGNNTNKIISFLKKYSENYLNIGLNEKNEIANNTINFINKQLVDIRDSLIKVETSLEKFKRNNPKIELSKKEYGAFYQIQKLEEEQAILKLNNKYYYSLKEYLNQDENINNVLAPSAMGINDPLLNNLINELSKLYTEFEIVSQNTKEIHPAVRSLRTQIKATKEKIIENTENIIASSELSLVDIENRINEFDKLINTLPESERKLVRIQRKYTLNETTYTYLLEKRAEASIAKAGNVADNKIIDQARLKSKEPISPKPKKVYLISIFLGIFIPGVGITILNLTNNKIIKKTDIRKLSHLPIIGSIISNNKSSNLIIQDFPKSAIAESLRTIRTNIQYLASENSQKVICISSSISGEGKSFCSINLASVLASTDKKTLLIGADMRKPRIFDDFNLSSQTGLSSYLISSKNLDEIIQKTKNKNLDIIISGPIPPNPSELLEKKKMNELIDKLKEKYNYIIIDTPPIGLVTDAQILMNKSDINLIIIRQNYTTKKMVENIQDITSKNKIKNVSLIFNDVKNNKNSYAYNYGYGYYEEDYEKKTPWWKIN